MTDLKKRKITHKIESTENDNLEENKLNNENKRSQGYCILSFCFHVYSRLHLLCIFLIFSRLIKRSVPLKVLSRVVVIFSLLIVVYFSSKDEKFKIFAKQTEVLPGKGQIVECSTQYLKEVDKFEGCFPQQCKRFVTDKVIAVSEADELLLIAKKGLKLGGSTGGASILDLHSGALSMGEHFINIYKRNKAKTLFTDKDFNTYRVSNILHFLEELRYFLCHLW